jgi:hypothetical protein
MRRALPAVLIVGSLALATAAFTQSFPVTLGFNKGPQQPIAYSHKLHAGTLGINCLYCHYGAEKSPIANIPAVSVCMGCHKIAAAGKPEIVKLASYYQRGEPVPWVEVNKLPEHVKFNHKRHVKAGVQCMDCHGPINTMDVVYQWPSLKMGWCISCHRQHLNDATNPTNMDCLTCHH